MSHLTEIMREQQHELRITTREGRRRLRKTAEVGGAGRASADACAFGRPGSATVQDVQRLLPGELAEAEPTKTPRSLVVNRTEDLIGWLTDIHYSYFMSRADFWSRKDLQAQDMKLCVLLSDWNLRRERD